MHKSEAIEDLRVRRTRKLLQQAFIECTMEKGFAALTALSEDGKAFYFLFQSSILRTNE